MAEDLYELYEGLFDQQVDLAEEAVIGVVRAAFGDLSINFKRHLRFLVPPRFRPPSTSIGSSLIQQQFARAEEEIESACDSAQRQIATALANGFGALANLPPALGTSTNQSFISGSSTQATVGANEANNNVDNSDDDSMSIKSEDTSECESECESQSDEIEIKEEETNDEMPVTAGTSNVNSNNNNDTVLVKTEIESECDSSDSESSDEEEEFTAGREIKEEIDDAHPNDQIMGNSVNENGSLQVMEGDQAENETHSIDNTNDYNFERSDAMTIENDEASNEGEDDDEPTIIVVNYEEFEMQSFIGNPNNQDTVAEGSWNEESDNIAEPDGEFDDNAEMTNSNDDADEHLSEAVTTEAISDQDQSGHSFVANSTSTLTRCSTPAPMTVSYAEATENSLSDQQGTLSGTRKRSIGPSGKSSAPKRSRVVPAPTDSSEQHQVNDDSENEVDPESEAISLSVIVRHLNCRIHGCKKVFPDKFHLDNHLLVKHAIQKYACKVKGCTQSYATLNELTTHRNSAHDNLDNELPCAQCEVTRNSYQKLCNHIHYYHEYGLFACSADKCNFTEKTRIKVESHQRKHRPAKHAKYRCTYAGCSLSFKFKSALTAHSRVHSKERPFLCSQCNKPFAQKSNLTDHERIHSGLKPFSCTWPHCDFSASGQSGVIAHIRGVHFGLPVTMKEQREKGIIDHRDARLFFKKTTNSGN